MLKNKVYIYIYIHIISELIENISCQIVWIVQSHLCLIKHILELKAWKSRMLREICQEKNR